MQNMRKLDVSPRPGDPMLHPALKMLHGLRDAAGPRRTEGLPDEVVAAFLDRDPRLGEAIEQAAAARAGFAAEYPELSKLAEPELIEALQAGYVNFYGPAAINPYVAMAASGPWIVTAHGAVVHDNGGYGMLGQGHAPPEVLAAMNQPWVMANVMTASVSHKRLDDRLRRELGHARRAAGIDDGPDGPFARFLCMNSGSESVSVAGRIADVNTLEMTRPGGRHEGKAVRDLVVERSFHGRTDQPAKVSHSSRARYTQHLASFRDLDNLWVVPADDVAALEAAFARADAEGVFVQMVYAEPVQGEGAPGRPMARAWYDTARRLTKEHGSLLLVDSIQAGLRTYGVLSVVDYPDFLDAEPPDLEAWSKALNAGQYPLSVLGLNARAAALYRTGIYGNTMTANPRALEVACAVLDAITPELRANVVRQGDRLVAGLRELMAEAPKTVLSVEGTGLLFCCELDPDRARSIGPGSAEELCRLRGLGVIHGGRNALRFTPPFTLSDAEADLLLGIVRDVILELDARAEQVAAK